MAGGVSTLSLVDAQRNHRERRPRTGPGRPRWLKEAASAASAPTHPATSPARTTPGTPRRQPVPPSITSHNAALNPVGQSPARCPPSFCYCPAVPPSPVHARNRADRSAHHAQGRGRRGRRSRRRRHLLGGRQGEDLRRALLRRVREVGRQAACAERLHGSSAGHRVPRHGSAPRQHVAAELRDDPTAGENCVFTGWTRATSLPVNPSNVSAKTCVPYFGRRLKNRTTRKYRRPSTFDPRPPVCRRAPRRQHTSP